MNCRDAVIQLERLALATACGREDGETFARESPELEPDDFQRGGPALLCSTGIDFGIDEEDMPEFREIYGDAFDKAVLEFLDHRHKRLAAQVPL